MVKYVCSVCGYEYEESNEKPWNELPEDWVCPLCGASKSEFVKKGEAAPVQEEKEVPLIEVSTEVDELSPLELSALFSNLARGCEKQYKQEESELFKELAGYFKKVAAPYESPGFDKLLEMVEKDLSEGMPNANAVAAEEKDRGALRALTWSEKVTRMIKSILTRYMKEGDAMLENAEVHVCTICGFVYIGDKLPDVCPVCKVPNWKFEKVG